MQRKKRILLVDDHPVFREGVRAILDSEQDFTIIAQADDGDEAIQKATDLSPDVIILDLSLPKSDGFETARRLRNTNSKSRILALSTHHQDEDAQRCFELGIQGLVTKEAQPEELIRAIRAVSEGRTYPTSDGASNFAWKAPAPPLPHIQGFQSLSAREREVLKLLAKTTKNKDIAESLRISVRTVEKHRANIMKKLRTDNIASLIRLAITTE